MPESTIQFEHLVAVMIYPLRSEERSVGGATICPYMSQSSVLQT